MKKYLLSLMALLITSALAVAQRQVTGRVLDGTTGEGLPGVSVVLKNTTTGTTTNGTGDFTLSIPATGNVSLVFSFVGYVAKTVEVGNQSTLNVTLGVDARSLEEVVVIGYGQVKKSDLTGAVVSVKPEDLKKVPVANVMESLQGRLPGVDIVRSNGSSSSGVNITVRGNRSLTASNGPLFIVDGIQYGSIQDINPNDVQSMEVLKDAASTAIYGSRGANGVIIVTTKKGAAGQTKVSINSYVGQTDIPYYPQVNDGAAYIAQKREANRTTGLWASPADDAKIFTAPALAAVQRGASYDWPGLFIKNGLQQEHQISVSGGAEKTKFYLSADYYNEQGNLRLDKLNRYSVRLNLDHSISAKVKVGAQNQIIYYNQNNRRDPLNIANKIDPLGAPYDENGNVIVFPNNGKDINPLSDEISDNYVNNVRTARLFTTAYLDYQILPSLNLRSNLGITLSNQRTGIFQGSNTVDRNGSVSQASYGTQNNVNLSWENILNYQKTIGDHSLTATGVTSLLTFNTEAQSAQGRNQLLTYQAFYALGNANQQVAINSAYTASKLISFTGRVQYGFKSKYLLTLTGRSDGASQLAAGNKWAFFPSLAGAWRIVEEGFMKNTKAFSDLKVRVSYGIAGNAVVDPYSSQSTLLKVPFSFGETAAAGYTFNPKIGNADLGWELSATKNIGLDFGLFNNRLSGSIDAYDTQTRDLLLDRFLPMTSGVSRITQNVGKTRNQGLEIGLNGVVIDKNNFRWNAGVTWFTNKERIVELSTASNDINNGWFIGYPTRVFYDYQKAGIWQTSEADAAKTFGYKPGQIKVQDQNNDGKITPADDRTVLGSALPKWSGSFNSDMTYRNFSLSFQVFARYGQMLNYEYAQIFDPQGIENSSRQNYWTPENASNDYPRPDASVSKSSMPFFSTLSYRDGSYVKLRGITLGYNLPGPLLKKLALSSLRIYVQGKNVLTFSKIPDYDPERGGAMSNPIPRVLTAGLNLGF